MLPSRSGVEPGDRIAMQVVLIRKQQRESHERIESSLREARLSCMQLNDWSFDDRTGNIHVVGKLGITGAVSSSTRR